MKLSDLHLVSPYDGFVCDPTKVDLHGWASEGPVFNKLIEEIKPELIVEVGTWKGASAVNIARLASANNPEAKVVCVDTWLGSPEFWDDKSDPLRYGSMNFKNGYPQVYYTFLNNVVSLGLSDVIIPFPTTSFVASQWFKTKNIKSDLIYIDATHEYEEVKLDIQCWFSVLKDGGVLFGDDYNWAGVKKAVDEARISIKGFCEFREEDGKWLAKKIVENV